MKCCGNHDTVHEIFRVVSRFPRNISYYTVSLKIDFLWDSAIHAVAFWPVEGYLFCSVYVQWVRAGNSLILLKSNEQP